VGNREAALSTSKNQQPAPVRVNGVEEATCPESGRPKPLRGFKSDRKNRRFQPGHKGETVATVRRRLTNINPSYPQVFVTLAARQNSQPPWKRIRGVRQVGFDLPVPAPVRSKPSTGYICVGVASVMCHGRAGAFPEGVARGPVQFTAPRIPVNRQLLAKPIICHPGGTSFSCVVLICFWPSVVSAQPWPDLSGAQLNRLPPLREGYYAKGSDWAASGVKHLMKTGFSRVGWQKHSCPTCDLFRPS